MILVMIVDNIRMGLSICAGFGQALVSVCRERKITYVGRQLSLSASSYT